MAASAIFSANILGCFSCLNQIVSSVHFTYSSLFSLLSVPLLVACFIDYIPRRTGNIFAFFLDFH
jgi:hypothetical protein